MNKDKGCYWDKFLRYRWLLIGIDPSLREMGIACVRLGVLTYLKKNGFLPSTWADVELLDKHKHQGMVATTFKNVTKEHSLERGRDQVDKVLEFIKSEKRDFLSHAGTNDSGANSWKKVNYTKDCYNMVVVIEVPMRYYSQSFTKKVISKKGKKGQIIVSNSESVAKLAQTIGLLFGAIPSAIPRFVDRKSRTKDKMRADLIEVNPELTAFYNSLNDNEIDAFGCIKWFVEEGADAYNIIYEYDNKGV